MNRHDFPYYVNDTENIIIDDDLTVGGNTAITGDTAVTGNVTVGGTLVLTPQTPASASDTGTVGQIAVDDSYVYVCTATNTWCRAAVTTWP